ncbi:MAG: Gfo/Idh/MocA family protein [Acidimicrobiales bacterium]
MEKTTLPTGAPARVLAVAADGAPGGTSLLRSLTWPGTEVEVHGASDPPAPSGFAAVIVEGDGHGLAEAWLGELSGAIERGTSLLVLEPPSAGDHRGGAWHALAGGSREERLPATEWLLQTSLDGGRLARRLPEEIPVEATLAPLRVGEEWQPVLTVSVAFRRRVVVATRSQGAGRVTLCGILLDETSLSRPELRSVLRRALHRRGTETDGVPVGIAVIGYGPYGGMGLYHGLAARATPGLELVAACDSSPERRKAAEEELPGLRVYPSPQEVIADEDVSLVVVATPPDSHVELCLALLRAGKHVACEKPLCTSSAEADLLIEAAEGASRVLTVHQSRRWDPDFLAIRRAVEAGVLGEVFSMETFVGGFEHPCRAWHSEESISGGAVYDWGSHHIDWVMQLMPGDPQTVSCSAHKRVWHDVTNFDQIRVRLGWEDGREAEFVQSDVAAVRRPKFYVQGTRGTLVGRYRPLHFERLVPGRGYVSEQAHHAEAPAELTMATYESGYGLSETRLPLAHSEPYGFHANLTDHLLHGEPLAVTPDSVREVVAVLEASQRSARAGGAPFRPARAPERLR